MAELQLPKLITRVRFPSSAPKRYRACLACALYLFLRSDGRTRTRSVCGFATLCTVSRGNIKRCTDSRHLQGRNEPVALCAMRVRNIAEPSPMETS